MKKSILIAIVLLMAMNLQAQLYVAGKIIPTNVQYINVKMGPSAFVKVNYGQDKLNNQSVITEVDKAALKIPSAINVLSYLDNNGWEPAVLGKELNDFALGIRPWPWLLFKRK